MDTREDKKHRLLYEYRVNSCSILPHLLNHPTNSIRRRIHLSRARRCDRVNPVNTDYVQHKYLFRLMHLISVFGTNGPYCLRLHLDVSCSSEVKIMIIEIEREEERENVKVSFAEEEKKK